MPGGDTTGGRTLCIDGERVAAERTFPVVNPATEEVIAQAPAASAEQLEAALAAAQRASLEWGDDERARRRALSEAAGRLRAQASDIARVLTLEQGKPLALSEAEVSGAVDQLERTSELQLPGEVLQEDERGRLELAYRPFGVSIGITPWNFPIMIGMSKLAPALLAGNAMVLKPSPFTPLSSLMVGDVLGTTLPRGVCSVLSGGDELGERMVADPRVKKISFTGSVATGKAIAKAAAEQLKRLTLELGGNDPAIVLDDVEVDAVAPQLFWSTFLNSGQVCIAIKRLYVPESMMAPLVERLVAIAEATKVGDGLDPSSQLGPINNAGQLARVVSLVREARESGAIIHCGGERLDRKGYFYPPTIVTGVDDDLALVAEEQFGPVLPVLPYRSLDEVIARANASPYGLGASVWSGSRERARSVAARIDAGTVWINQHMRLSARAPFAGAKCSGIGAAGGRYGVESFLQRHVINERIHA